MHKDTNPPQNKLTKSFNFPFPLKEEYLDGRTLRNRTKVVALYDVHVSVKYDPRESDPASAFDIDIDYIFLDGHDVKVVYDFEAKNDSCTTTLEKIRAAALEHCQQMFHVRATPLQQCINLVKDKVGAGIEWYLPDAVRVKINDAVSFSIWGVCVAPTGSLFVSDGENGWDELTYADAIDKKVVEILYAGLKELSNQKESVEA